MYLTREEKERMAEEDYSLIYFIAHKFTNTGYDVEELASVATVGFTKALNSFNKEKGVRFSTYSVHCMRNEILFFLRKERQHTSNTVSLNYILSTDHAGNEFTMENLVSDKSLEMPSTEEQIESREDAEILHQALEHLTENERYIAIYRFGINKKGIKKTQREIAEVIGMSQANVSKIQKSVLDKLKGILTKNYNMLWDEDDEPPTNREKEHSLRGGGYY